MSSTDIVPPKAWGWRFNYALDRMKLAYDQACQTALAERAELVERSNRLDAERAQGITLLDHEEWVESLNVLEAYLADEWQENEGILRLIIEGFVMTLFHFWEKQIKEVMRAEEYNSDKAFGWLKRNGLAPDCKTLMKLKYAAETIKHSEGRSAVSLFKMEPSFFDPAVAKVAEEADYDAFRVEDIDFHEFFEAVRTSGPQSRSISFK